jgi:transcription elongation factor SPT6
MTSQIFVNASGFLKIAQDPYDDSRGRRVAESIRQDPLDATRIHPEDYDLARKMATDALELDDEDIANQHPSAVVTQLMQDEGNGKKLDDLSLDDFALNLQQNNNERKRHTLDMIRDELLHPFGESRTELPPMSDWDVVTMLTGETRRTLQPGRVLTVTVGRVRSNQVDVRTDSGLDGYISKDHLTTDGADPGSLVKARQTIQAVILKVEVEQGGHVRIRLASRPDAIAQADEEIRGSRVDSHYDMAAARQAKELQQRKQRSEANRSRRVIKHPAFKNFNSKEAETYLAPLQHGDAVIRPSSKGPDHLAVTWKVADGVYQHIGTSGDVDSFTRDAGADGPCRCCGTECGHGPIASQCPVHH